MTRTPVPVTVIGLGNLGHVLAETFLAAGHPTTVWNRSPGKAAGLVARGAVLAGSAAEAVAASGLVVVCVLDYPTAREILAPAAAELSGRVLVNLSTGTPEPARALAAWAADQGSAYLDGAVYAVPQTIGAADAFVLFSGDQASYAEHESTLARLGAPTFVGTDPGRASVYDVALLSGMYGMLAGQFQSVALARSAGITATEITGLLVSWLVAVSAALPHFAAEIDSGDYGTTTSNIAINATGLGHILAATAHQGVPTDLLEPLQALLNGQLAEGHAAASLSRVVEGLRGDVR
ncbi:NAD(P)-binding domain-containing protein [Kitasatospora sp. NPDC002040]|uniref:NAD(P)-dependent oxidoreductase n=1 Tax=Kitasatospora sp. NPDC002040 TaxID=3154661 RepID=UPI0033239EA4